MIFKKVSVTAQKYATELTQWNENAAKGDSKANRALIIGVYKKAFSNPDKAAAAFELLVFTDQADIAPNGLFLQEASSQLDQLPHFLRNTLLHAVKSNQYVYTAHRSLVSGIQELTKLPVNYPALLDNLLALDKACKTLSKEIGYTAKDSQIATAFKNEVHAFMVEFAQANTHLRPLELSAAFEKAFDSKQWTNRNRFADLVKVKALGLQVYKQMMIKDLADLKIDDDSEI